MKRKWNWHTVITWSIRVLFVIEFFVPILMWIFRGQNDVRFMNMATSLIGLALTFIPEMVDKLKMCIRDREYINDKPKHRISQNTRGSDADKIVKKLVSGRREAIAREKLRQVFYHPAADHAVIRRDDDRHQSGNPP